MRLLTLLLLLATLLFADSDKYEYKERHLPLDMHYLELTHKQHDQAKSIVRTFKHEYKEFHHLKKETREAVSKLFLAETFDSAEFIRLTSALNHREAEIQSELFSRMHGILTPSQKKRFVNYMEEWEVE
ncbi:MAG: Spy/CpxP family protein refolding chaperone [Helicobacteraceae bacterium]|jgi:Spy/CpxP family protein refolding chaperone|nr:Spy/CpxP family protein refolding chaperone [Helicobacteraceae bacterium]